jgi:hypothetical protein
MSVACSRSTSLISGRLWPDSSVATAPGSISADTRCAKIGANDRIWAASRACWPAFLVARMAGTVGGVDLAGIVAVGSAAEPRSPRISKDLAAVGRVWGSQSRFGYAACEYSLINPLRIDRR